MQYLKLDDNTYYNAAYVVSVIEGPYIGIKRQVTVKLSTGAAFTLVNMTAATLIANLVSDAELLNLSAYYQRPY